MSPLSISCPKVNSIVASGDVFWGDRDRNLFSCSFCHKTSFKCLVKKYAAPNDSAPLVGHTQAFTFANLGGRIS